MINTRYNPRVFKHFPRNRQNSTSFPRILPPHVNLDGIYQGTFLINLPVHWCAFEHPVEKDMTIYNQRLLQMDAREGMWTEHLKQTSHTLCDDIFFLSLFTWWTIQYFKLSWNLISAFQTRNPTFKTKPFYLIMQFTLNLNAKQILRLLIICTDANKQDSTIMQYSNFTVLGLTNEPGLLVCERLHRAGDGSFLLLHTPQGVPIGRVIIPWASIAIGVLTRLLLLESCCCCLPLITTHQMIELNEYKS